MIDTAQQARVIRYYEASHKSFTRVWSGRVDRAIHFGFYDRNARSHSRSLLRLNEILADIGGVDRGDHVIDAGCGFGGSAVWLAKHRDCSVVGINITEPHLDIARSHAEAMGMADRVSFVHADFAAIPLPPNCADIYWAVESTVHASDRAAVIGEAFRVLKPGGRFVIVEYCPAIDIDKIRGYEEILSGWAMPTLWTTERYLDALNAIGFREVRHIDATQNIAPSLRRMRRMCRAAVPITRTLLAWNMYDPARVAHNVASLFLADAMLGGELSYVIFSGTKPTTD